MNQTNELSTEPKPFTSEEITHLPRYDAMMVNWRRGRFTQSWRGDEAEPFARVYGDGIEVEVKGDKAAKIADMISWLPRMIATVQATAELQADNAALVEFIKEEVGMNGYGPNDRNDFYCEFCKATHEDYTLIPHTEDCILFKLLSASHPGQPFLDKLAELQRQLDEKLAFCNTCHKKLVAASTIICDYDDRDYEAENTQLKAQLEDERKLKELAHDKKCRVQAELSTAQDQIVVLRESLRKTVKHLPIYKNKLDAAFGRDPNDVITSSEAVELIRATAQQAEAIKREWREANISECIAVIQEELDGAGDCEAALQALIKRRKLSK